MPRQNPPAGDKSSNLGDTIFAVVHLLLIIAVFVYGIVALVQ